MSRIWNGKRDVETVMPSWSWRRPGLQQRLSAAYWAFIDPKCLTRPANDDHRNARQIDIDPMFLTAELPAVTDLIGLSFPPFDREKDRQ